MQEALIYKKGSFANVFQRLQFCFSVLQAPIRVVFTDSGELTAVLLWTTR